MSITPATVVSGEWRPYTSNEATELRKLFEARTKQSPRQAMKLARAINILRGWEGCEGP